MVPGGKLLVKLAGLESIAQECQKRRLKGERAYQDPYLSREHHVCSNFRHHTPPRIHRTLRLSPQSGSMGGVIIHRPAREPPWDSRFLGPRRRSEGYESSLDDHDVSCRRDRHLRLISPPRHRRRRFRSEPLPRHRDRRGDLEDYPEYSESDYESDYITDGEADFEISSSTGPGSYVRRRPRFHDSVWDDHRPDHHNKHLQRRYRYEDDSNDIWDDDTIYEGGIVRVPGHAPRDRYRTEHWDGFSVDSFDSGLTY